jgi:CheY-like chemotaxis protein
MGGTMSASSVLGAGSTFTFALPLASTGPCINAPSTALSPAPVVQRSLSVLLAEDNLINQRVATALLEAQGHRVQIASTGVEALEAFKRSTWDVVILDVQMPEMDGIEAARLMRAVESQKTQLRLPILALTASAMQEEQAACFEAGMDAVLSKPITREALRLALATWCA